MRWSRWFRSPRLEELEERLDEVQARLDELWTEVGQLRSERKQANVIEDAQDAAGR